MDDNEKHQLHEDVRQFLWKLAGFDMLRVESMGDMFIMDDRFLRDFSLAWKGASDDIPQSVKEEWHRYQQQQKQQATTVSIGGGPTYISASEGADRLTIHGGTGYIPIDVDDIDEVIAALQRLRTLLRPAAAPTSSAHNSGPKSAVPSQNELVARSMLPNIPGVQLKTQWEKNMEALNKALGLDY